jgi:hypothetical protein
MLRFNLGAVPILRAAWRDPDTGAAADATTTIRVTRPDGTTVDPPVVRDGQGEYHALGPADQTGVFRFVATASGELADRQDGVYIVVPDYADLPWAPSSDDVAQVIARFAVSASGLAGSGFTNDTPPTKAQVEDIVTGIVAEVSARAGAIPEQLYDAATAAAAAGAAADTLISFFPEQAESAAALLERRYQTKVTALLTAIGRLDPGSGVGGSDGTSPPADVAYAYPAAAGDVWG